MKNKRLLAARKAKELTQEELAIKLGFKGKQTVANWENGHSQPTLNKAIEISKILEQDIAYLFGKHVQETYTNNSA
ncbi:helix-turn-helix transcriptional regulator [Peribacillus sp. B-H-3]|uniref:helix-turn-helix transcriptional regulator n=1 Tax=Peribacillus sp. B-H-3 TaxID=3400420 RepID=UPI003B021F34